MNHNLSENTIKKTAAFVKAFIIVTELGLLYCAVNYVVVKIDSTFLKFFLIGLFVFHIGQRTHKVINANFLEK